jgi:hypothetical protein
MGYSAQEVLQQMKEETSLCGRDCTRDIKHSLKTGVVFLKKQTFGLGLLQTEWKPGNFDKEKQIQLLKAHGTSIVWSRPVIDPYDCLREMFGEQLVCIGKTRWDVKIMTLDQLNEQKLRGLQYVVPTPMFGMQGRTQTGGVSPRCLDNVARRWFLVVEFDGLGLDEQSRLHYALSLYMPLRMIVFSGNKSLHGWFDVYEREDSEVEKFFQLAVSIGADPATWTRCQLVRIPGGVNQETGKEQSVVYYDLSDDPRDENSSSRME